MRGAGPVLCPHAERCPGCAWIGLPLAEQLAAKQARLASALAPYATLDASVLPTQAAAQNSGYRTRAKLVVAPGPRLGLFARGTHEALDLPGCPVLAASLAAATEALRGLLRTPPPGAESVLLPDGEGAGRLRAVDLREVAGDDGPGVLLTLVLRAPAPEASALAAATAALRVAIPALRSLALRLHHGRSPGLLGGPPRVIHGAALVTDRPRPGAPSVLVGSGAFVQAHRAQAARLQAAAESALGSVAGRRVLDVYAGNGALGLSLAAQGARALLVEGFAPQPRPRSKRRASRGSTSRCEPSRRSRRCPRFAARARASRRRWRTRRARA